MDRPVTSVEFQGLLVSDLDGTLIERGQSLSNETRAMFRHLGEKRVCRVIATGRSLYSARKILQGLEFDFLLFSTGAGIVDWPGDRLVGHTQLLAADIVTTVGYLLENDLAFMLHHPIPENHRFFFFPASRVIDDFERRCALHADLAQDGRKLKSMPLVATQIIAIEDETRGPFVFEKVKRDLASLSVIRATSPLDDRSTWIEIFPPTVAKGLAAERLRSSIGVRPERTFAIGNDFNDIDLLEWAEKSYVVEGAPEILKARYRVVSQSMKNGFAEAVAHWLSEIRI